MPALLRELGVDSILDAPCGDFNWMRTVNLGTAGYIGVDVVPELVARNEKLYGSPSRTFIQCDITRDSLPRVDIILCRDCLVHLPDTEINRAIRNFKRSGSTYLLTTTYPSQGATRSSIIGLWRPLNLELPPFSLAPPLRMLAEGFTSAEELPDKSLGLWRLEDI